MPASPGTHCPQCGYDLRGQIVQRCPECGFGYDARALQRIYRVAFRNARDGYLELVTFLAATLPLCLLHSVPELGCLPFSGLLPMLWLPAVMQGWVLRGWAGVSDEIIPDSLYEFARPVGTAMDALVYACFFLVHIRPLVIAIIVFGCLYSMVTQRASENLDVLQKLSGETTDLPVIVRRAQRSAMTLAVLQALGWFLLMPR